MKQWDVHTKPLRNVCPREYCWFWDREDTCREGEPFRCACTRRNPAGAGDWYEPLEPILEKSGLPWFYFISSIDAVGEEQREAYRREATALWGPAPLMTYFPALPSEAGTVFELRRQLSRLYGEETDLEAKLSQLEKKIREEIGSYTVIGYDGQKAGYFSLRDEGSCLHLEALYVYPPLQRKGIATAVLDEAAQLAAVHHKPIRLFVYAKNAIAVGLYKKMGYRLLSPADDACWEMELLQKA